MLKGCIQKIILLLCCGLQISCAQNVFSNMSSKTTDEALFNDARAALNIKDYQVAIDIILNEVSTEGKKTAEAKELLASGYAGRCGLNFLNFIDSLSHASNGTPFGYTAAPFVGVDADPASCVSALSTMESIGPSSSRTMAQNGFTAIAAMALMGSSTRLYTDNSPVGGNGIQDAANISCTLTNTQVDNIILGFGFMSENLSALSTSQLGSSGSAFSGMVSFCSSLGTSCNITDPAAITPPLRDVFRRLLNTKEYGIGTVVSNGNPTWMVTACP